MKYYHIKGKLYQTSQEKPNIGDLVTDGRAEKIVQIWKK
jgi:hypothetical protein